MASALGAQPREAGPQEGEVCTASSCSSGATRARGLCGEIQTLISGKKGPFGAVIQEEEEEEHLERRAEKKEQREHEHGQRAGPQAREGAPRRRGCDTDPPRPGLLGRNQGPTGMAFSRELSCNVVALGCRAAARGCHLDMKATCG